MPFKNHYNNYQGDLCKMKRNESTQSLGIKIIKLITTVFVLMSLFYIWPNFVHEPLHYIAVNVVGADATINLDLKHFPAHPSTTWVGDINTLQWMFLALLPSVITALSLVLLSMLKVKSLLLHGALGTYLTFDLVINLFRMHEGSDFIMLANAPIIRFVIIGVIMCVLAYNVMRIKEVESFIKVINVHKV